MVSQSGSPPIPMPVQVPPGHVMQQIVDENGTLRHVILSTQHQQIQGGVQHHMHGHYVSTSKQKISHYTVIYETTLQSKRKLSKPENSFKINHFDGTCAAI